MFVGTEHQWASQVECLWQRIEAARPGTRANRSTLGMYFAELRDLYSDRNCGGHRLSSGHGSFENEIRIRGYRPRTVRSWIEDYLACLEGRPTSATKRQSRRSRRPLNRVDPLNEFVALLPFNALHSAYRAAAMLFHPDHGGDQHRMHLLNEAWARVEIYCKEKNRHN